MLSTKEQIMLSLYSGTIIMLKEGMEDFDLTYREYVTDGFFVEIGKVKPFKILGISEGARDESFMKSYHAADSRMRRCISKLIRWLSKAQKLCLDLTYGDANFKSKFKELQDLYQDCRETFDEMNEAYDDFLETGRAASGAFENAIRVSSTAYQAYKEFDKIRHSYSGQVYDKLARLSQVWDLADYVTRKEEFNEQN